jgi:hypothetical protein
MEVVDDEWLAFPGGELEGERPKALCPACRAAASQGSPRLRADQTSPARRLCFQCYRVDFDRRRQLKAAAEFLSAPETPFQGALPFEPVNRQRLERLRIERQAARSAHQLGAGRLVQRRREAQIAARHALARITEGLRARAAAGHEWERAMAAASHAAELQLPDAWLPFVVAR